MNSIDMSTQTILPPPDLERSQLLAILREELPEKNIDWTSLLTIAKQEGVAHLLHYKLLGMDVAPILPADIADQMHNTTRLAIAEELVAEKELNTILSPLKDARIPNLLLKGTALAYSLYSEPYLRTRCDTDILFPDREMADRAFELLATKGYERAVQIDGTIISHQFSAYKKPVLSSAHSLDMHWKLSNKFSIARLFTYENLAESAIPLPPLGPNTLTLSPAHMLLHACLHRSGNRLVGQENRLIWLYDIKLLCEHMKDGDWRVALHLCRTNPIAWVVLDGIKHAVDWLGATVPETITTALTDYATAESPEKFGADTRLGHEWQQLSSLPNWQSRLQLIREHLFPSANYMRNRFEVDHAWQLPYFYLRRILRGLHKLVH